MSSSSSSGSSPRTNEPKLTRQKNLRYLSEQEIDNAVNLPEAADESPSPQPLPLPQLAVFFRKKHNIFSNSGVTDCPLPSPKENHADLISSNNHKKDQNAATRLCTRRRSDVCKVGSSLQNKFKINVPTRSVPTSSYGSLLVSPPGKITTGGDFYPYYYLTPKANDIWSAPEMPTTTPPTVYDSDTQWNSFDQVKSPPQTRNCLKDDGGVLQGGQTPPLHNNASSSSSYGDRTDTTHVMTPSYHPTQVHRLPLPPEPSPSLLIHTKAVEPTPIQKNGTWKKGKLLGRGTFGSVYAATNRETGALCAMKEVELCPDDPKSIECMKQIQQEIKVLSRLKHPNIVQYYGSEIVDDRFYIYLEYVHPGSINRYVREHCGAMTESVVRNFTRHILSGLAYLHNKKTIHRDIKGANLLVDACGVVKLADFGMAKHLSGQATDLSLKGSPYWMAPELMEAVIEKDHNSELALAIDIWSLGCTIIEMFTGKPPWSEYEGVAAMFKVLKDTPPIPPTLSSEGKDFLQCCFQRNPAQRPSASMLLNHSFLKPSNYLEGSQSRVVQTNHVG